MPEEANLIREAARRLLLGDGVQTIVRDWNVRGVPTTTGKNPWTTNAFKQTMRSPRLAGFRTYHGEIVAEAEWPAILEPAESEQVRALLDDPARRNNGGYRARVYLLTGFVRCGVCGEKMYARKLQRGRPAYFCRECGLRCSTAVEDVVSLRVRAELASPVVRRAFAETAPAPDGLIGQIEQIGVELHQWDEDRENGVVDRERWLAVTGRLNGRRDALRRRLGTIQAAEILTPYTGREMTADEWTELAFDRKRAIIGELVESIVILPATRGLGKFDEGRVQLLWRQ